jgi:hypothetical protein
MSLDGPINILVTTTLIEIMVSVGLRVTFAETLNAARSWPLIARAAPRIALRYPTTRSLVACFAELHDGTGQNLQCCRMGWPCIFGTSFGSPRCFEGSSTN